MISRRIAAYFIDLALFTGVVFLSILVGGLITNSFTENLIVRVVITLPLFVVFVFITSGLLGVFFKGSIGKKFMDLKVTTTVGFVTAFRLLFRDLMKYTAYIPFLIGVYALLDNRIEHFDFFISTLKVSGALLLLLVIAQGYYFIKKSGMIGDQLFFTLVENDIPTATEYDDLLEFVDSKKTIKK